MAKSYVIQASREDVNRHEVDKLETISDDLAKQWFAIVIKTRSDLQWDDLYLVEVNSEGAIIRDVVESPLQQRIHCIR